MESERCKERMAVLQLSNEDLEAERADFQEL